jgi:type I restriction enzyme, S subunit
MGTRNIQDGYLSLNNVDFVPNNIYEKLKQRLIIEPGDVLLSCSGSVGRSCVAPENLEFALVRSVAVLKPLMKIGNYLSYAIRSPLLQLQINERITQTAQANIFQNKIKTLIFPLPPQSEQQIIVQELDYRFSIIDEFNNRIDKNIKISNYLRQSILRSAFKGMLVSQNPNDGQASTIIEQIKEDRIRLSFSRNKSKRKKVNMSKSRRSLYEVLAEANTKLSPEELFDKSGHSIKSIDEFYEELREEIFIKSRVKETRLNEADVYLKVRSNENI